MSSEGEDVNTSKPVYIGSVKSLFETGDNELTFVFSDRYSIFDWGEMPNHIPYKGEALGVIANYFFNFMSDLKTWKDWNHEYFLSSSQDELLNELCVLGARHHFKGESTTIKNGLRVQRVQVPKVTTVDGDYNYGIYKSRPTQTLVPLEVIFRHGVPPGSSLVKRNSSVSFGDRFKTPYVEFSTKLESKDRYISRDDAIDIAGLNQHEWERLNDYVVLYSLRLKDFFSDLGIELWDGKFEFAFSKDRDFILVDSIGPDELRLTKDGLSLSKEFLREYYEDSCWKASLDSFQKKHKNTWKKMMVGEGLSPDSLACEYLESFSLFYRSLANELTKTSHFDCCDFKKALVLMNECRHMRCK